MVLAVLSLLGGVAVAYTKSFTERVRTLAAESPEQAAALAADVFKAITALMGVIPLAVGFYLAYVSVRAWETGEFPPPGTRVLRDTVVTVGTKSRLWAAIGLAVALALIVGGMLIPMWGWQLSDSLVQASAQPVTS
jgi:hypothetical protein